MKRKGIRIIAVLAAATVMSSSVTVFANTEDESSQISVENAVGESEESSDGEQGSIEALARQYIFWDKVNGDDESDGVDAENAVLTLERAAELYGEALEALELSEEATGVSLSDTGNAAIENRSGSEAQKEDGSVKDDSESDEDSATEKVYDSPVYIVLCFDEELSIEEQTYIGENEIYTLTYSEYELLLASAGDAKENDDEAVSESDGTQGGQEESGADSSDTQDVKVNSPALNSMLSTLSSAETASLTKENEDTNALSTQSTSETASLTQEGEDTSVLLSQSSSETASNVSESALVLYSLPGVDLVGTGTTNTENSASSTMNTENSVFSTGVSTSAASVSASGSKTMTVGSVNTGDRFIFLPLIACGVLIFAAYMVHKYISVERIRAMLSEAHETEMQKFRNSCMVDG